MLNVSYTVIFVPAKKLQLTATNITKEVYEVILIAITNFNGVYSKIYKSHP